MALSLSLGVWVRAWCREQSPRLSVESRFLSKQRSSFKFSFELQDISGEAQPSTLSQREVDLEVRTSRRRFTVRQPATHPLTNRRL